MEKRTGTAMAHVDFTGCVEYLSCKGLKMPRKVLLSSVFKPFAKDSIYGRADSKIELYHNQITKYQGIFSIRSHMNSFGLHAIANNIGAPATVLDFPTLERFRDELKKGYDIIGIGSIIPNFQKVKRMVEEARKISPRSTIVVGGFCATLPDIEKILDVDYVCVGEGISFMRGLLGEDPEFEFKNPRVFHEDREFLGVPIRGVRYPHIVVGLGCSYGCELWGWAVHMAASSARRAIFSAGST